MQTFCVGSFKMYKKDETGKCVHLMGHLCPLFEH